MLHNSKKYKTPFCSQNFTKSRFLFIPTKLNIVLVLNGVSGQNPFSIILILGTEYRNICSKLICFENRCSAPQHKTPRILRCAAPIGLLVHI